MQKIKLLKNYLQLVLKVLFNKSISIPKKKHVVYFNLNDKRLAPYYFHLVFSFYEAGFKIYIQNNIKYIANCVKADRYIFKLSSVSIYFNRKFRKASETIYFYDRFAQKSNQHWLQEILIDCNVWGIKPRKDNWFVAPFPMSPDQYINGAYRTTLNLCKKNRIFKIIFSGNTDKEAYTNPIIKDFFKKVNRYEIIQTVKKNLNNDEITIGESHDSASFINKLVLFEWSWSPTQSVNLKVRIDDKKWLSFLARSQFILATPGIRMPLCFNVIEAMSVGTIPIIQYPEHFNPPLVHGINAVVFENEEDLIIKIRRVLAMDQEKISLLSQNVINYYEKYLHIVRIPELTGKKISRAYISAEQASLDDYS